VSNDGLLAPEPAPRGSKPKAFALIPFVRRDRPAAKSSCTREVDWENRVCGKTWEWLIEEFFDVVRAVISRIWSIKAQNKTDKYLPAFSKIKKDLFNLLDLFPDISWIPSNLPIEDILAINVARIPPTDEGSALINNILDQLKAREREIVDIEANEIMVARERDNKWFEELLKRSRSLKEVIERGKAFGIIQGRGPYRYFRGRCIGRGPSVAAWGIVRDHKYDLESEIRMAVARAAKQKQSRRKRSETCE